VGERLESRKDGPTHDVAGRHTSGLEPENPNYFQGTQTRRLKADARFAVCSLCDVGTRISVASRKNPAGVKPPPSPLIVPDAAHLEQRSDDLHPADRKRTTPPERNMIAWRRWFRCRALKSPGTSMSAHAVPNVHVSNRDGTGRARSPHRSSSGCRQRSGAINQSGYVHRRQWAGRAWHEVRVHSHRCREHQEGNNDDYEPTHSLK
jgi:hypothetical protein